MRQCVTKYRLVLAVLVTSLVGLVACGESPDSPSSPSPSSGPAGAAGSGGTESPASGGSDSPGAPESDAGGDSDGSPGRGILSVRLTDSPYEAAGAVLVTIPEISVHRSGAGWVTVSDDEFVCDLKQLQNGTDTSVGEVELTAGHYTQIRLIVLAAALYESPAVEGTDPCQAVPMNEDRSVSMDVPSGTIRLTRQFTVAADGLTTISLDFDGDRSIRQIGNRSGNSNGNGNNGNGNNGNGNSGGDEEEEEEKGELDLDGRYQMHPVIKILSVEEQESPE